MYCIKKTDVVAPLEHLGPGCSKFNQLRGQLVKCFTTLLLITDIFCWKNEKSFSSHTSSTKKYWHKLDIKVWNSNERLTKNIFSFEQPGPGRQS